MPDCVSLVRYRTCPGIVSSVHSGTGLTECRTVRHFYIQYICTCSMRMYTDMQHEHKHAAWTQPWTTDMGMQLGHWYAEWTWSCSIYIDMQHGNGNAAWTWACIMDMDIHHGQGHAAQTLTWTLTWTCNMDMQYGHAHAAWTWTRNSDLVMQHGLVNAAWIWTVDMHGCRNADKKTQSGIVNFPLVHNSLSGIDIPASRSVQYR
jgi:hypothetical protein